MTARPTSPRRTPPDAGSAEGLPVRRRARDFGPWLLLLALAPGLPGCALFEVAEQQERLGRIVLVSGTVRATTGVDAPLIVVASIQTGEDEDAASSWTVADYVVRERPGYFRLAVAEGRYRVGAYQDLNANLKYDSQEPAARLMRQPILDLSWGDRVDDLALVIQPGSGVTIDSPFDVAEEADRAAARERIVSLRGLVERGAVLSLDDPRFAPEIGPMGLWKPADFLLEARPGVYFLDEYDPGRIPVVFVHGLGGYPQEFGDLIEALDRERFQPWVYLYPSGVALDGLGLSLAQLLLELQVRHGFQELALVAHSMGGLVSRSALFHLEEQSAEVPVPLFVSISSPFGGHAAAQSGADRAEKLPEGVSIPDSFLDMAPKSEFLRDLFFLSQEHGVLRPLPPSTRHHLIFGFRKKRLRTGPSSDGTIPLDSQLRAEAQIQAASRYGVDADHVQILHASATAERVNALLNDAFD